MKILVLTQREDCSLDELVATIQMDPALTGRIIKLATSVQLAGHVEIATVKEAAVRLGLRTVSNVALGFTLISGNRSGRCGSFDYDKYWGWSLANAVAAQVLSSELRIGIPAEAFTCALLSRIGRLALASVHPTEYAEVLADPSAQGSAGLATLETQQFNINHREVAAAMLQDWGLPRYFTETVLTLGTGDLACEIEEAATYDLIRLLNSTHVIADVCVEEEIRQPQHWNALREICADLDVKAAEFCRLFDLIVEQWKEWGSLLKVPTSEVLGFRTIEERAQDALLARSGGKPVPAQSKGLRILAVDDDPLSLKLLVKHLEKAGHHVVTATNGKEALGVALEWNPQIVVTDWMMPEMDGLELCKALRRFGSGRNLYVLILTGRAEEDRVVEAFEAGADDYIVKPFKPKLLLARIRGGQRVVRLQEQVERDKRTQREQVSKLAVLNRKLKAAAMTDPLTELPNRRYAMRRMEMEWANAVRSDQPFSLIMIDVDRFKSVNDTWGHDVGDAVLQSTAKAIHRTLRRGDVCARMGGEEFLVICPSTDEVGAIHAAERIRVAIEENHIITSTFEGNVTASLGVGSRDASVLSIDALLKLSDLAVYEAKRLGRNQVRVSGGSQKKSA